DGTFYCPSMHRRMQIVVELVDALDSGGEVRPGFGMLLGRRVVFPLVLLPIDIEQFLHGFGARSHLSGLAEGAVSDREFDVSLHKQVHDSFNSLSNDGVCERKL